MFIRVRNLKPISLCYTDSLILFLSSYATDFCLTKVKGSKYVFSIGRCCEIVLKVIICSKCFWLLLDSF